METNAHTPKVGDILVESAGYSTTYLKWYEVTKATKATVLIRQIKSHRENPNDYAYNLWLPTQSEYHGEPMRRRFETWGNGYSTRTSDSGYATLWDGKPKYCAQ